MRPWRAAQAQEDERPGGERRAHAGYARRRGNATFKLRSHVPSFHSRHAAGVGSAAVKVSRYDGAKVVRQGCGNAIVERLRRFRWRAAIVVSESTELEGETIRQLERQGDIQAGAEARR